MVGSLRARLARLERAMRGTLKSFALEEGTRHYYDPTSGERFLHSMVCLRAQGEGKSTFPEPPETIRALTRAGDRSYGHIGSSSLMNKVHAGRRTQRSLTARKHRQ